MPADVRGVFGKIATTGFSASPGSFTRKVDESSGLGVGLGGPADIGLGGLSEVQGLAHFSVRTARTRAGVRQIFRACTDFCANGSAEGDSPIFLASMPQKSGQSPFFGQSARPREDARAENIYRNRSRVGIWSIFRPTDSTSQIRAGRKHGPDPLESGHRAVNGYHLPETLEPGYNRGCERLRPACIEWGRIGFDRIVGSGVGVPWLISRPR